MRQNFALKIMFICVEKI